MTIKPTWENNELYKQGKVEMIPTDWVWKYWGKDVSPVTNLKDGTPVGLDELWAHILENGLDDPLIMRVGLKNKKFRLESGNHRIQVLHKNGIKFIPVIVQIKDECGPQAKDPMTDATHNFDFGDEILISDSDQEYRKPSEVFKSLSSIGGLQ